MSEAEALIRQLHAEAVDAPRAAAHHGSATYTGSPHGALGITIPVLRQRARAWLTAHRTMPADGILATADALFAHPLIDTKILAAILLGYSKPARRGVTPSRMEAWLDHLAGWAEIDSLCQGVLGAEEMLADWPAWHALVERLATDQNINKRRAGLVLLVNPTCQSPDARPADAAFAIVTRLQAERAILITKAVSWLLRSLIAHHRDRLTDFLEANRPTLPAIALREVRIKLETGRKTPLRTKAAAKP